MNTIKHDLLASHEILGILELSKEISNFIWDHLPFLIILTDYSGNILKINSTACRFLKKTPDKMIGTKIFEVLNHESSRQYFSGFFCLDRDIKRPVFQTYIDSASEYIFWQIKYLRKSSDRHEFYAVIGNNIKELRQAYQGEMIKTSTLTSMATLAGGVAHELNNPLTIVQGCAELIGRIVENSDHSKLRKLAREIHLHTERMSVIIRHLRNFAHRTPSAGLCELNLNLPVQSAINFNKSLLQHESIEFELNLGEQVLIPGNEKEIESVIHILLHNSRDAFEQVQGDRQKKIEIETKNEKHQAAVIYKDNASGIHPDTIDRIFDPFFTTKEVRKGTGLGLSRLYNIIKMHSGDVQVSSTLGSGTTFTMTFPKLNLSEDGDDC